MESYEELLEQAYAKVKVIEKGGERFEIPRVEGQVSGNVTFITNIQQIANYIRRPLDHLAKFLLKELATSGRVEGSRLLLNTKLSSDRVNEKIALYAKEFVLCPVCGKPDTEIQSEKGIRHLHCLACGAKSPIKYHL